MALYKTVRDFDIPHGVASIAITTTGTIIVATTAVSYFGCSVLAATTSVSMVIYDNSATATGRILDLIGADSTAYKVTDKFNPVKAKAGIAVNVVGTGAKAVIFYMPKG